jgi:hypothetical protein
LSGFEYDRVAVYFLRIDKDRPYKCPHTGVKISADSVDKGVAEA